MTTPNRKSIVLIVEDDEDIRLSVADLLEEEGYGVVCAQDGQVALDVLASGLHPAVVLLDLMLPVVNGWKVWDWLQVHPTLHDVPVVIFTATGLRSGSMGAVPVLEKPFDTRKLVSTIANAAQRAA